MSIRLIPSIYPGASRLFEHGGPEAYPGIISADSDSCLFADARDFVRSVSLEYFRSKQTEVRYFPSSITASRNLY